VFKSLYCDGHCGRKCDPSQRTGSNIIALPWWWYCETCRKKRENPNLPPDQKRVMTEDEIDRLKKKLEKLEKENEIWKKENEKLEEVTKAFKGEYHDFRKKLENFYDIIVDIDSLRHMVKGWKVKFTEIGKKNYDIMKDKELLIVGVVGNRNRGKSFVLSKLSNVNLPDGTSIKTEGISIKYPKMEEGKEAKYILMDSAGFENALLETDEFTNDPNIPREDALKMLKLIASDKTLTEYFIQNFIIQKSNVLIVVIGILNYPEQKLLNRIKTENKNKFRHQTPPPLFVVHNLQTFSLKKQVTDYIEETLLKSATFKLKQMKSVERDSEDPIDENDIYFIEEFNNKEDENTVIYHLILAMHGTEAGDYYNRFTYEFLSKRFDSFPIHKKFPIIEDVKQQCMENSYKMMIHPIKSLEEFEKSESEIKLISKDKEEDQKRLVFKRCLVDELGFSNFYGANFEPKYAYFKTIIDKKPYVCIQVEIPGECTVNCRAKMFEQTWNVTVKGNKMLKMNDGEDKHTSFSKREEGDFNLLVKLNVEDFQLKENKPDKSKTTNENGLYSYYFPLVGGDDSDSDKDED
jgi:hypothetical protein